MNSCSLFVHIIKNSNPGLCLTGSTYTTQSQAMLKSLLTHTNLNVYFLQPITQDCKVCDKIRSTLVCFVPIMSKLSPGRCWFLYFEFANAFPWLMWLDRPTSLKAERLFNFAHFKGLHCRLGWNYQIMSERNKKFVSNSIQMWTQFDMQYHRPYYLIVLSQLENIL